MKYAILCFTAEELSIETPLSGEEAGVINELNRVCETFEGRVTYSVRLQPATSAVSVRKSRPEVMVVDGPFIESKEHLVGFYLVECESLDLAIGLASDLVDANPWGSGYEIRPIRGVRLET